MCEEWRLHLKKPNSPGKITKLAIVPRLESWMGRSAGSISFHLTQILTGHGCFGKFLFKIGKRDSAACKFCNHDLDDIIHTLRDCSTWDPQRNRMKAKLGLNADFTLKDIEETIIGSNEAWMAFSAFVEEVMGKKEEEERWWERARN